MTQPTNNQPHPDDELNVANSQPLYELREMVHPLSIDGVEPRYNYNLLDSKKLPKEYIKL